jgi:hypothetical protein
MNVNVEIPDDLAQRLSAAGADLSRRALEGFALEEYKAKHITKAEFAPVVGLRDALRARWFLEGASSLG